MGTASEKRAETLAERQAKMKLRWKRGRTWSKQRWGKKWNGRGLPRTVEEWLADERQAKREAGD